MGVNPYAQYQKTQVETADQGKLLLMLYDGALRFLGRARLALQENNGEVANNNLVRTQEIIAELMASLDLEAGDVAGSLFRLYEYMHYLLVQANLKKEDGQLQYVEDMLLELKEAWSIALGMAETPSSELSANETSSGQSQQPEQQEENSPEQEKKKGAFPGYGTGLREAEAFKNGYKRVNISG